MKCTQNLCEKENLPLNNSYIVSLWISTDSKHPHVVQDVKMSVLCCAMLHVAIDIARFANSHI